jgi:enoyl-CoA hydratase
MEYTEIERDGAVVILRLNRPPVNAINLELVREAADTLAFLSSDDSVSALVVTGAGRCFSAGLDLKAVPFYTPAQQKELVETINRVITTVFAFARPTVAAINGHAIAGGFILAASCDYRVCAEGPFQFGVTEVRAGIPFPISTMEVLKSELRPDAARRMILGGATSGPADMLAEGVFDELVPAGQALPRSMEVAQEMARLPRLGYESIKNQLRGDAIDRIERVMESGDPLIDAWLTDESVEGAAGLLNPRPKG